MVPEHLLKPHYVYFFETKANERNENNYIKIGMSNKWHRRYWDLNSVTPFKLYVKNVLVLDGRNQAYKCENWFHRRYKNFKVNGEWFHYTEGMKKYLVNDFIKARSIFRRPRGLL